MFNSKKFKEINEKLDTYFGNEFSKLKKDSEELKQIKSLLAHIQISVKRAIPMDDGTIKIVYELPTICINPEQKNELFYSINMLNLISIDDMKKIQKAIDTIKN